MPFSIVLAQDLELEPVVMKRLSSPVTCFASTPVLPSAKTSAAQTGEVSGAAKQHWNILLGNYVQKRDQLVALVLIMDSRRPFTDLDVQMLEWFADSGRPVLCLLTKADKLNRSEATAALRKAEAFLEQYHDDEGPLFPYHVQLFSSLKRTGVEEADEVIRQLLGLDQDPDQPLSDNTSSEQPDSSE